MYLKLRIYDIKKQKNLNWISEIILGYVAQSICCVGRHRWTCRWEKCLTGKKIIFFVYIGENFARVEEKISFSVFDRTISAF